MSRGILAIGMVRSLVHGWRSWKSARGVGLLAIAALALGIGSTTAIYSVVQAVLLNPLPYEDPGRYFLMWGGFNPHPQWWSAISYPDAMDYAAQAKSLEVFGCSRSMSFNLSFRDQPLHVIGSQASAALMKSLGIKPEIGRWYDDVDKDATTAPGAVLSGRLWRQIGIGSKHHRAAAQDQWKAVCHHRRDAGGVSLSDL